MTASDPVTPADALAAKDLATRNLNQARTDLTDAATTYDNRRRYAPAGRTTASARSAWALALITWAQALITREEAKDQYEHARRGAAELDRMRIGSDLPTPTRRTP